MRLHKYLCEWCMKSGTIRQPKEFDPNSDNPIMFLGMVVRCDEHCEDYMK